MSDNEQMPTVGFIGLGNMGIPMITRIVGAGYPVEAFDVSADARARAVEKGARDAGDAVALAAASDVVILMLPNSAIVESVVAELRPQLKPGALIVDMSSSEPLRTRALAEALTADGIRMIDAPVSGGVGGAVKGSLTIMVGGTDADVADVRPLLETMGRVIHAGSIGAGHAIKALNNLLSATHLWVTSEAITAGVKFGLDPATMLEIFNSSSGRSGSTENKWPNFIVPGTFDSGFGLRLMLKDMKIAVQMTEQTGAPSVLGADAVALWSQAADELEPTADHTEIARWIERRSEHETNRTVGDPIER